MASEAKGRTFDSCRARHFSFCRTAALRLHPKPPFGRSPRRSSPLRVRPLPHARIHPHPAHHHHSPLSAGGGCRGIGFSHHQGVHCRFAAGLVDAPAGRRHADGRAPRGLIVQPRRTVCPTVSAPPLPVLSAPVRPVPCRRAPHAPLPRRICTLPPACPPAPQPSDDITAHARRLCAP